MVTKASKASWEWTNEFAGLRADQTSVWFDPEAKRIGFLSCSPWPGGIHVGDITDQGLALRQGFMTIARCSGCQKPGLFVRDRDHGPWICPHCGMTSPWCGKTNFVSLKLACHPG